MTPTPERLKEIEELCSAATPTEPLTLNRYDHGGGRLYLDGESGQRELVADFYHEGDREFYTQARGIVGELTAAIRSLALTWTHEAPTAEGWWWYEDGNSESEVVEIQRMVIDGDTLTLCFFTGMRSDRPVYIEDLLGRWSGPIPMPVEPEEDQR